MSIIDRFHAREQSDSQLDIELQRVGNIIEHYEQEKQKLAVFEGSVAEKEEAYERICEQIYLWRFQQEKLLKIVDKRAARLARAALTSREKNVK